MKTRSAISLLVVSWNDEALMKLSVDSDAEIDVTREEPTAEPADRGGCSMTGSSSGLLLMLLAMPALPPLRRRYDW